MAEYIRFEKFARYHLVLARRNLLATAYITYCGRIAVESAKLQHSAAPGAVCKCCLSRQRHPYLIPEKFQKGQPA